MYTASNSALHGGTRTHRQSRFDQQILSTEALLAKNPQGERGGLEEVCAVTLGNALDATSAAGDRYPGCFRAPAIRRATHRRFFNRALSACSFGDGELLLSHARTRWTDTVCFVAGDETWISISPAGSSALNPCSSSTRNPRHMRPRRASRRSLYPIGASARVGYGLPGELGMVTSGGFNTTSRPHYSVPVYLATWSI